MKSEETANRNTDGLGLAEMIRKGEISAVEATEGTISRIEQLNGTLNAVVTSLFEQALEHAKGDLGEGPFAGVPYLLKDLIEFEGVRLTNGSRMLLDNVSDWTPPYVEATQASGLNFLGKTNTPEFGLLGTTESLALGPCANPWNTNHSSGGSSGGAAVAVASGMVPFAHASDGGGSIRIPASCCGLFGLKPSRGRMLQSRRDPLAADISVEHCVSRSVRDSAMLFSLTEQTGEQATLEPTGYISRPAGKKLKIAFSTKNYYGLEPAADVKAAIENTAKLCESMGHDVVDVGNPFDGEAFINDFLTVWASGPAELKALVEEMTGQAAEETNLLEPWTLGLADFFNAKPPEALSQSLERFAAVTAQLEEFNSGFDVWLTPVLNSAPPLLGEQAPTVDFDTLYDRVLKYVAHTPLQNVAGTPAMSVPLGWNEQGLPIGSQFAAPLGREDVLFALAYELEEARPWADKWAPASIASQK